MLSGALHKTVFPNLEAGGSFDVPIQNAAIAASSGSVQSPEECLKANRVGIVSLDELRAV